jgi:spore germination protein KB
MLERGKISNTQLSVLIITYTIGTSILTVPVIASKVAKQDGWISSFLAIGCGLLLVLLYGIIAERSPNQTLAQYSEKVLGKWCGGTISILFSLYYLLLTSIFLRVTGDFITTHILTETPIQAVEILFLLPIIYAVRLGLEPLSRTSEMVFPYIISFIILSVLFLLPHAKVENLTPFLENGVGPVFLGAFDILGAPFLNLFIFLMITPFVNKPKKIIRNLFFSTLVGGVLITVITLLAILVLGADVTARLNYSPYMLAQRIDIGNFIQRIEIVAGAFIFISLFIKTAICYYSMVLGFAQTLRLKNYKLLTLPLGFIVLVFSITFFPNIIYFQTFNGKTWTPITLVYGVIFPLLLLSVDLIKSKS